MMLVTSAEMGAIDSRSQSEFAIPGAVLMESAAAAAWTRLRDRWAAEKCGLSIVFLVGHGNNGGDALVMARYCAAGGEHHPVIVLAKDGLKGDAELQRQITQAMKISRLVWTEDRAAAERAILHADLVVDGLAGTGITGPLRAPLSEMVEVANRSDARVVAVDCPSGVGDHGRRARGSVTTVMADATLTLGLPKRCLFDPEFRLACGAIEVVPFAIPPQLIGEETCSGELLDTDDLHRLLPPMSATAHKGQRGVMAVYAGATGTSGAAVLAAQAALSAGAGLVTAVVAPEVRVEISARMSSVMVRPEDPALELLIDEPERFDAVVVGPGWGVTAQRAVTLSGICRAYRRGVIDADGLTVLSALDSAPDLDGWVLTPHPGELGRLLGLSNDDVVTDIFAAATEAARKYNAVVVAKASTTVITRPDGRLAVVDGHNPAMATAGSGDVLSGTIGALLARGASAWDAGRGGALAHRDAGVNLRARAGLYRSDALADAIGVVMGATLFGG